MVNNKKIYNLNPLRTSLGILAATVVIIGLAFLSNFLKQFIFIKYIGYVSFIISIVIIIINVILLVKRSKNLKAFKLEEQYNLMLNYKEEANDFQKVFERIKKDIRIANLYIMFVFALQIITFVCLASRGDGNLVMALISAFLIIDIVCAIFDRLKESEKSFINEIENYPYIKNIIENCKNKLGITEKIILTFSFESNIGVFKIGKQTVLNIGVFDLLKVNEKELEAIIYHEMAHIYNEDTLLSYKVLKSAYLFKNLNSIFASFGINLLFFSFIISKVNESLELFLHFIRLEREKKADSILLENGDKQEFINAIAKTYIQAYQDQYRFNFNVFKFENVLENYLDYYLEESIANYYEKEKMYNHFLANSLQRLFDTHPNLKTRMKNLGVENFNINFNIEKDKQFEDEVNKIKEKFNKEWAFNAKPFWEQNREHNYVFYTNELEKINAIDYNKLNTENKVKLAYCNIVVNNLDFAEEIYTDILNKYPNNIAALLNRGFIRYGKNDKECIKDFEKVKKMDYTLTESINFYIGTYYNNNGDEEAIKKYREENLKEMTNFIDRQRYFVSKGINAYEENKFDDETIALILEKIKNYSCVKGIYYLKLNTGRGLFSNLLLFDLNESKDEKERNEFMDEMTVFLPTLSDEVIYFDDITFSKFFKNIVKKKKIKNLFQRS